MSVRQRWTLVRILAGAALLVAACLIPVQDRWLRLALFAVPYLVAGADVLRDAALHICHGQVFDENFLMSIATLGAFATGEYTEAVAVILFYQVGELFQDIAVGRSRRSIAALMDIRPDVANVERAGALVECPVEAVEVGEVIAVRPGERVPLDGVVLEGASSLDTAALTGEPMPRDVAVGDEVVSGCVNLSGLLRVRVSRPSSESTVTRILELVENSAASKAKAEAFITRFARWYTPVVVIGAALLAVVPPLFDGAWHVWPSRALVFLVISCPCALVISVPLTFFGGIGGASRCGVLVKGANYLEALARVDTVVFDKTGTLTCGTFEVTQVHPEGISADALLELAALAESGSNHPIAQSLRAACPTVPDAGRVDGVEEAAGQGVLARVDGRRVAVGNGRLMEREGAAWQDCETLGTVVHVALEGRYVGHIVIADRLKDGAAETVRALKSLGVRKTVMLTGDRQPVAERVAGQLGLDEVRAELLPADKVAAVEALLAVPDRRGTLVYVGDGLNDAPVLSRSDVGIAMGGLGSDAAIEAADVVLMDDRPEKLALVVRIARRTRRIVTENIVFALGVKAAVLALGAAGLAGMWLAVFADVGVCVLAVLNAMRMLRRPAR